MYSTFGDKPKLFEKAFELYKETVFSTGMNILNGQGTPLENVRTFVAGWSDFMACKDRRGCLISQVLIEFAGTNSVTEQRAKEVFQRIQTVFEQKLTEAKELGELDQSKDPKELAAFLMNTAQGLTVMSRAGVEAESIKAVVKTTLTVLA